MAKTPDVHTTIEMTPCGGCRCLPSSGPHILPPRGAHGSALRGVTLSSFLCKLVDIMELKGCLACSPHRREFPSTWYNVRDSAP